MCGLIRQYDCTRPVYIVVELPKSAVSGEQLAVQIAVFNYRLDPQEVGIMAEPLLVYNLNTLHSYR